MTDAVAQAQQGIERERCSAIVEQLGECISDFFDEYMQVIGERGVDVSNDQLVYGEKITDLVASARKGLSEGQPPDAIRLELEAVLAEI
jgi:hypothetical protein